MRTVVVPLSAFLRFMSEFVLSSVMALTSLHDKMFFGVVILISESCILTLSK